MNTPGKQVNYFEFERNAPCPCGSGSKYKRCCLGAVESADAAIRRTAGPAFGATHLTAPLRAGLALACGLRPGAGEEAPDPEDTGAAVANVLAAMEDRTGEKATALQVAVERLLRDDGRLAACRFDAGAAAAALNEAITAHPDRRDSEEAWARFMTAALRRLVAAGLTEAVVRGFFAALRRPGRTAEEREAAVWGLLQALATPHIPLGYNFLWRDILRLTLEDVEGTGDLLEEIEDWEEAELASPAAQPVE